MVTICEHLFLKLQLKLSDSRPIFRPTGDEENVSSTERRLNGASTEGGAGDGGLGQPGGGTFLRLREMLASHVELARRLDELEKRHDQQFTQVFAILRELLEVPNRGGSKRIAFAGG